MALKPTNAHNAIVIPHDDDGITLRIPLRIQGFIAYFHTHKPTKDEFESCDNKIEMTADSSDWDPSTNRFQEQEDAMLDGYGRLCEQLEKRHGFISPIHTAFSTPDEKLDDALLFHQNTIFQKHPKPNAKTHHSILALKTNQCKAHIGPATLAKNWGIGISSAKWTINATM